MKKITEALQKTPILLSDGSWGTLLHKEGLNSGECPELWCLEHRDKVLNIATSYIQAGSDMIETNSFGGTSFKLEHFGLSERVSEINEAAAAISREAAGADKFVIASVGPTGKILLMGEVSENEIYDSFAEQVQALEKGGADACCIETFAAIDEAELAVRAVNENTDLETIVTFTFEQTLNDEYRTMMGVSPAQMAKAMLSAGADIIGTNCGNGMKLMAEIVSEIRSTTDAPVMVQANAGAPINVDGVDTFPESPDEMAKNALDVVKAGANIIGGCCGTTPQHIQKIAQAINKE